MTKLSLLLLAAIPSCVAQLVATKWNMDNPTFTLGEDAFGKAFTFEYGGISDLIDEADADYAFFDFDCATEVTTAGAFTVGGFTLDAATADSNDGSLKLIFEVEPEIITAPTTLPALYTAGTDGGEIKFCVRTSLNLIADDESKTEINFLETQVTIAITLQGTFTTENVSVAPKDKTTTDSQQTYTVEAKMCDPNLEDNEFNQGEVISVCVKPFGEAVADGIIMASVDSFTWERGSAETNDLIEQPAVKMGTDGMIAYDALSSYEPESDGSLIKISSVLFASFYATSGSVVASGSATMQFPPPATTPPAGDGTRRRLGGDDNNSNRRRRIQSEDGIPPSPFDVRADVVAATDGPAQILQTAGGASTTTSTSMIGAIVVGLVSAVLFA